MSGDVLPKLGRSIIYTPLPYQHDPSSLSPKRTEASQPPHKPQHHQGQCNRHTSHLFRARSRSLPCQDLAAVEVCAVVDNNTIASLA